MFFNTLTFAGFLPVALAGSWILRGGMWRLWILAMSYVFYGAWDPRFLLLIMLSTGVDYVAALQIQSSRGRKRRRWLLLSLCVNLGILGVFKYLGFFVESAAAALAPLGISLEQTGLDIVLPVGISFYTFQTLSYTVDVYRGTTQATRSLLTFAAYVAFFPQLVAGPIERSRSLLPQLTTPRRRPSGEQVQEAMWLLAAGYFKKMVVADNLAAISDLAFGDESATAPVVVVGTLAFTFQIYGDFSGYSDIARGSAKLMGVDLVVNFRSPYLAAGPSDFWRRWHVSLSTWLRDYLYIPLGGNRLGTWKLYRNLAVTMLLGGLWHGAAWTYVVWGGYQGVLLIGERLIRGQAAPQHEPLVLRWGRVLSMLVMFVFAAMGWMIFRAPSIAHFWEMTSTCATGPWALDSTTGRSAVAVLIWGGAALTIQLAEEKDVELPTRTLPVAGRLLVYLVLFYGIVHFGVSGGQEFIYFQF